MFFITSEASEVLIYDNAKKHKGVFSVPRVSESPVSQSDDRKLSKTTKPRNGRMFFYRTTPTNAHKLTTVTNGHQQREFLATATTVS